MKLVMNSVKNFCILGISIFSILTISECCIFTVPKPDEDGQNTKNKPTEQTIVSYRNEALPMSDKSDQPIQLPHIFDIMPNFESYFTTTNPITQLTNGFDVAQNVLDIRKLPEQDQLITIDEVPKVQKSYKVVHRKPYGTGYEAKAVERELDGFRYKDSHAYSIILQFFGKEIRLQELKGVILAVKEYLAKQSNSIYLPPLSRNTKRSFPLLVKYIEDHLNVIAPILPRVKLCDQFMKPIQ